MLGKKLVVVVERDQSIEDPMADSSSSSDSLAPKSGLFRISGLFVRLSTKALLDPDLARSPTSPLDYKVFSNLGTVTAKSPKSWDCNKIGLGLVDALSDESFPCGTRKVPNIPSSIVSFSILQGNPSPITPFPRLGQQHIELESAKSSMNVDGYSSNLSSLSMSEITRSEDYTCIISRGPKPKTTHILGDCILLDTHHSTETPDEGKKHWEVGYLEASPFSPCGGILSRCCCSCNKKLKAGNDIYIYLGEKAFYSSDCRESCTREDMEEREQKSMVSVGSASDEETLWM